MTSECSPSSAIAIRPGNPVALRSRRRTPTKQVAAGLLAMGAASSCLLLPLGLFGWIGSAAALLLLVALVAAAPLRRARAAVAIRRERWARRAARERSLPFGSPERIALTELTRLVDLVEHEDAKLAQRLELEALLDRHVALTIAHQRALRAVSLSDRDQLQRICDDLHSDPDVDPRRLELCERRIRCHEQCEVRAERLADDLAIVDQLIRLVAQRALCPDDPTSDDVIDRRLTDLDADEAALRMLAAEFH